jgi:hypothetical protein
VSFSRPATNRQLRHVLQTVVAACLALFVGPTQAAEKYGNSLDWVPADASMYSASLRLKEQIDIVAGSNAWKKFREIPSVAAAWQMAEAQVFDPTGPASMFWQMMELPENKQLVQLLGEMFSDEVVVYAGADFDKFLELMQIINGSRMAPIAEVIQLGDPTVAEGGNAQARMVIDAIVEDPALLDVPEVVFAFRIKDREAATTQLARLEVVANMLLGQTPLGIKLERRTLGDAEHLVLPLNGAMIPLPGELPPGLGIDDDSYRELKLIVAKKELFVTLGTWEDYLLLSFGKSIDHLADLGSGAVMAEREELASLPAHRERKLVAVSYVSGDVAQSQALAPEDLDGWADYFATAIEASPQLPADAKERINSDLHALADDFKPYLGTAGATAGYAFLNDDGYESFYYDWSELRTLDAGEPLELIEHLGGRPLIAIVARGVDDPEGYDLLVKWIGKGFKYFEDYALEQMDEEERQKTEEALEVTRPLVTRFDETTRNKLMPALADGQTAVVFDADAASNQWHEEMPPSFRPLPMLEFGVVFGVSDAEKLVDAMSDYRAIINDAIAAIRERHPDDVPDDVELPAPDVREISAGKLYHWPLPAEVGLDDQIAPCGAVSDEVAVFATTPALAERLLETHAIEGADELLGDASEPRGAVAGVAFADLIAAIEPWIEYGIREDAGGASDDPGTSPPHVQELLGQVRIGFQILQCFRGAWSETRHEDGVWVTHSVSHFEDLEN